ncbi:alpha/beta fold hydrolase [Polaribacter sp. HL-MS24]|uniref:alpha/beta fold hydrolase n=1 Tax=Polaribacter sp. HL-MS24 TaxID=3077735 RepID=UPI0029345BA6|nr:alpha/beta fold hydrolase [Polaribacter sp. HL-MS24]WOC39527.1 alpha/beta fold hydrolase [Polaribacter sp. HL-MS24]
MNSILQQIPIDHFITESGKTISLQLSYQLFGQPLSEAPVVLVNHALTGNSDVCGENGWWKDLIGDGKAIDTNHYTILAFNIPGNGFDGFLIENYQDFIAKDIAKLFLTGLEALDIQQLYAIIGGSLGGGIAWQMAVLNPTICKHLIPIASDYKGTDWLIANCKIQALFLNNSSNPINDARMHAMLLYRTPASFNNRFNRTINKDLKIFNIESWLLHHGKKLQKRFQLSAYKLMNHLLKSIDVTQENESSISTLSSIQSSIHIVSVDSDLFFTAEENQQTFIELFKVKNDVAYSEIKSIHGHDAFLIEFDQLAKIIEPIFKTTTI